MPQVKKNHYFGMNYHSRERFGLYFEEIDYVLKLNNESSNVLQIGVGNNTVAEYLKKYGVKITTCDFDKCLKPDILGDVRNLPIKDKTYDIVTCFEVLEHIPFDDLEIALKELSRVSSKFVAISVPVFCRSFDFSLKFFDRKKFKINFLSFGFFLPYIDNSFTIDKNGFGEHYWEVNANDIKIHELENIARRSGFKSVFRRHPVEDHGVLILELTK